MCVLSRSEIAFCFLNIAALISIVLYARHHIHSDTYEVHTIGKHGELELQKKQKQENKFHFDFFLVKFNISAKYTVPNRT